MTASTEVPSNVHRSLVRPSHIAETVVFVSGLYGCGKTLFSALVGSLDRMEVEKYDYNIEYACGLHFLGKLPLDAASTLVRMRTDLDLYDLMMSREANFRFSDLSSIWRHPHPWRYIKRLFMEGDAATLPRIQSEKPILNMVSHALLPISQPLFTGLGDRLRFIEVVRHPLYMVRQWGTFMDRLGTDPREFTLWFEYKNHVLPWFAAGIEDRYIESSPMDRLVYCMENGLRLGEKRIAALSETERACLMVIPFERFVVDPGPYMERLVRFLGTQTNQRTKREMKKQNVPRKKIADGVGLKIYQLCGWVPPQKGASEADELAQRRDFVAQSATPEALTVLDRLCDEYKRNYLDGRDF